MKESLLKLTKMLAEDEKFLKEFSSKKSVDEQYDFAQKSVSGYTKDEFVKFLAELEKSYELKRDISPEEMEKVSGGADVRTKAAAMAMLALSAVGSAAPMLTASASGSGEYYPAGTFEDSSESFIDFRTSLDYREQDFQPSRIGGPAVNVGASKVMRDNKEDIATINTQLNDKQLEMFKSAGACTDKGLTRIQEVARMKKLASHIETKSAMLNMIVQTFASEKDMLINWVRYPRKFLGGWTGWRMEDTPQIREKLKSRFDIRDGGHKARIINWLLKKFKDEGYYLRFDGDKLFLDGGSGPRISLEDDVASYASAVQTDVTYVKKFITELTQRLNRARVFGQSLKSAGMEVEGQWIMRDDGVSVPNAALFSDALGIVKDHMDPGRKDFDSYDDCSKGGSIQRTFEDELLKVYENVLTKVKFLSELNDQLRKESLNWTRHPGYSWTGWRCKIKLDKIDEMKESAKRGDARAQVLLWLNSKFNSGDGLYLYYQKGKWGLTTNTSFKAFDSWLSEFLDYSRKNGYESNDGNFKKGYAQVIRETNYHRALSRALQGNKMTVEEVAVMPTVNG